MGDGGGNRWLRDHFYEFVFPAFMAAEKKSSEIGKPFDVKPSSKAPENLPTPLKKLWTLCMETKTPWEFDVREINRYGGSSKYRERARIHNRILNDELASARAALRDEGCKRLFLGGRDTWPMAIMCARQKIPFRFVPELSRPVSQRPGPCKRFLEKIGFEGDELFLDTGFAGSIPKAIQKYFPEKKLHFRLISQDDIEIVEDKSFMVDTDPSKGPPRKIVSRYRRKPNQLLPNRNKAREEALETEYLAKYWKSGTYEAIGTQGFAPEIFKEWRQKPGLRRFSQTHNNSKNHGLFDGKDVIFVGVNDTHLVQGMREWIISLPEISELEIPIEYEQIVQYFSDRQTIQRAALLTCMIWQGIPYWKSAMNIAAEKMSKNYNGMNTVVGTNSFQVLNTATTAFTTGFTAGTNLISMNVNQFGNQITQQITQQTTAAGNAVMQQQALAMLAAKTQMMMNQGVAKIPAALPSIPLVQNKPITPDKIIILADSVDNTPVIEIDEIPVIVDDEMWTTAFDVVAV